MKFTFVILNYKNYEDTVQCINSILKNINHEKYIVVVDNASKNGVHERISDKYRNVENVFCIENDNNLGFAKGNNVGFEFAKNKLKSDYICLINNDTLIYQKDFIQRCIKSYQEDKYYILGPDIISTIDNKHQNPHGEKVPNLKYVLKNIIKESILYFVSNYTQLYEKLRNISKKTDYIDKRKTNKIFDVKLHGSCMVFSPSYVRRKDGIYDKTFMYGEEDILFYQCNKEKMLMVFNPEAIIYHKEGASTNITTGSVSKEKRKFYYKNRIKSSFCLLRVMIKYKMR